MTRQCLRVDAVPPGLLETLRSRAAGVPFLVEEMLSAYLDAGGPAERQREWWVSRRIAEALPSSYRAAVAGRLERLPDRHRLVASAAAVLGRTFEWRLLGLAIGLDDRAALDALRAAAREHLVTATGEHFAGFFEFRHALAREAMLAELLPPERADLSLRLARAIERAYPALPGERCAGRPGREASGRGRPGLRLRCRRLPGRVGRPAGDRSLHRGFEGEVIPGFRIDAEVRHHRLDSARIDGDQRRSSIDPLLPRFRGITVSRATIELVDAVVRMLRLLGDPDDARVLAPLVEREILWRPLRSPPGTAVRQIGLTDSGLSHVGRSIRWIQDHYAVPFRVEDLAHMAGTSTSAFHRNFRTVTAMNPIQFQKKIRLQEARLRLVGLRDDVARVGYDGPAQFSREYRREFRAPPARTPYGCAHRLRS